MTLDRLGESLAARLQHLLGKDANLSAAASAAALFNDVRFRALHESHYCFLLGSGDMEFI